MLHLLRQTSMTTPVKKIMRHSPGYSDSKMETILPSIENKSVQEISTKFRSPPPKPPRRRHSDQLTVSASGTFPSSRKRYTEENESLKAPSMSNNTSCGSLPANWTTDFNAENNNDCIFIKNSAISQKLEHLTHNTPIADKCAFNNCFPSHNSNIGININKGNLNYKRAAEAHDAHFSKSISPELSCKDKLSDDNEHFSIDSASSSMLKLKDTFSEKLARNTFHRRYHSEPLLSCFERSLEDKSVYRTSVNMTFRNGKDINNLNKCQYLRDYYVKEAQYLREECKSLKEMNNKLWEQLCSVQASLDVNKSEENYSSFPISAEFLSHMYFAQKTKDIAMEGRLKVALEDRDIAINELEEMVQAVARNFEDNDQIYGGNENVDKKLKQLLQEIEATHNPAKLLHQQRLLFSHLYHCKEHNQNRLSYDLKVAVKERDIAIEKVKQLENELKHLKLARNIWHSDVKHWESSLLEILCQVIEQRDDLLKNDKRHELNSCYINSNKLQHHANSPQLPEESSVEFTLQPLQMESKKNLLLSKESSSDEVKVLKEEIITLNKALKDEVRCRESAEENSKRLERLVYILRKKIGEQHVGVPV